MRPLLIMAGATLATAGANAEQRPAEIRIGYLAIANAQLIAKSLRLHERDRTVRVKWTAFATGGQISAALAAGTIDFGTMGGPPAAAAISRGDALKAIMLLNLLETGEALAVKPQADGKHGARSLKGMRIATPFGSTSYMMLLTFMGRTGISKNEIQLVDMAPERIGAAWRNGAIDAAYIWEPTLGELVKNGGAILMDNRRMAERGARTWDMAFVSERFARAYPAEIWRFVDAECAAITYWKHQPESAASIVANELGTGVADARRMMDGMRLVDCKAQNGKAYFGTVRNKGRLVAELRDASLFLAREGRIERSASPDAFARAIDPSGLQRMQTAEPR